MAEYEQIYDVIIVGGGISGLTALHRLAQGGANVVLLELGTAPGGVMVSYRTEEGILIEQGPNSLQTGNEYVDRLIDELGIRNQVLEASSAARNRYIVRDNTIRPLPFSPRAFLTDNVFSGLAKLRLLREPFTSRASTATEENIAEFVRRRLGPEFLDYAVNPFVSGIYAGDPERLSVQHAFPRLYALEQEHGSLIRGAIALAKRRKRTAPTKAAPRRGMISFTEGMGTFPAAIASRWEKHIRTSSPAQVIQPHAAGWEVITGKEHYHTRAVVLATAAYAAAPLVQAFAPVAATALQTIEYPPVVTAVSIYPRSAVAHPLDGFGLLIPAVEQLNILGTIFTSTLFPGRAPEGFVSLTTFIGGARKPELAILPEDELQQLIHADLGALLGITSPPAHCVSHTWQRAIPQYNIGYGGALAEIEKAEKSFPGLRFLGNYRGGISVGDCIKSGWELGEQLLAEVDQLPAL